METITFLGGDKRNCILSNMLESEYQILRYGTGMEKEVDYNECIRRAKYIVLPIPISTDGENLFMPFDNTKIKLNDLYNSVHGKILICGALKNNIKENFEKDNKVIDVMMNEELTLKNTIPTAEGVIKIIIENTETTIDNSNIAIIGFGRVGKKIAELLNSLNSNVFCTDIKKEEVANIERCGYNVLNSDCRSLSKFDVIINTVPKIIIDKKELELIDKKTLIVDVASNPGGINYEYAKANGYNCIHALGLPGKIAPETSAKYIKEVLINLLKWGAKVEK